MKAKKHLLVVLSVFFAWLSLPLFAAKAPGGGGSSTPFKPEIAMIQRTNSSTNDKLVLMNADGTRVTVVATAPPFRITHVSLSPSDNALVWIEHLGSGDAPRTNKLHYLTYSYTTSGITAINDRVLEETDVVGAMDVSPDGSYVLYWVRGQGIRLCSLRNADIGARYIYLADASQTANGATWLTNAAGYELAVVIGGAASDAPRDVVIASVDPTDPVGVMTVIRQLSTAGPTQPFTFASYLTSANTSYGFVMNVPYTGEFIRTKPILVQAHRPILWHLANSSLDDMVELLGTTAGDASYYGVPRLSPDDQIMLVRDGSSFYKINLSTQTKTLFTQGHMADWKAAP